MTLTALAIRATLERGTAFSKHAVEIVEIVKMADVNAAHSAGLLERAPYPG
jgi:hypothetical protein